MDHQNLVFLTCLLRASVLYRAVTKRFTWQTLNICRMPSLSLPLLLSNLFPHILPLLLNPSPSQGVWFRSQEAGQLGGERLPPVCRVGPRTTCLCHRQLHQQSHVVTAPIEGDTERKPKQNSGMQHIELTRVNCTVMAQCHDTNAILVHQLA